MSTEAVKASLIWENNSDTELSAENLSKMLDYQADEKIIYFTDSRSDYESWADLVFEGSDDFTYYLSKDYQDQIIYNISSHTAKKITKDTDGSYYAAAYTSPYRKLLKIASKTKVAMSFEKEGIYCYNSFDVGHESKLFSCDHLITGVDFSINTKYDINLYYHVSYGDYAQIKISKSNDTSWQVTPVDASSPSGYKLISFRKIGGFSTDENGYIKVDSIWDVSTLHKEIIVENLKKYDTTTGEIRSLTASDIPITDTENLITANNVEGALEEIKRRVNVMYDDLYSIDKFGMELKFCPIKLNNNSTYVDCITNELTLKITAGYIDVYGTRIKFANDVYLTNTKIKINDSITYANPAYLGPSTSVNTVYDSSPDGSGTIWRVFIDIGGNVILKESSKASPKYMYSDKLKGWYILSPVARCIGKFKVKKTNNYFIEKQSVTNTIERQMVSNEIIIIHGTMCPDGTVPCDGKWHDTIGGDLSNAYTSRPALASWGSSWYEETPYLWGKVLRMAPSNILSTNQFRLDANGAVLTGGCAETGAIGGSDTHTHLHPHVHRSGTLKIDEVSGSHEHTPVFNGVVDETVYVTEANNGILVTKNIHDHGITITGGVHSHTSESFSGTTATISGTDATTDASSSWAPYKEILYCIKV